VSTSWTPTGFGVRFDCSARAIRCAGTSSSPSARAGIEVRAGLHTGECEIVGGKCGALSVSIGARVVSNAGPSEVLVSQTVKDLVAGSGLAFEDARERELKGPGPLALYRVPA
jgi:class 3 adenylate cyclase